MIERMIPSPIMHRAVACGDLVFLGGIVADDFSLDMGGQTRQVLGKLGVQLGAAGSSRAAVLSATIFVTDLALKEEMNAAWVVWFGAARLPARATVGVADLGEGVLIEVSAIAARGE
jgi:2-iminobutanoate/2-iminopropanoate deaminase